jgi:hypothetical protein
MLVGPPLPAQNLAGRALLQLVGAFCDRYELLATQTQMVTADIKPLYQMSSGSLLVG